jgi:hypothetical protein
MFGVILKGLYAHRRIRIAMTRKTGKPRLKKIKKWKNACGNRLMKNADTI